jgi:hypothetical protein
MAGMATRWKKGRPRRRGAYVGTRKKRKCGAGRSGSRDQRRYESSSAVRVKANGSQNVHQPQNSWEKEKGVAATKPNSGNTKRQKGRTNHNRRVGRNGRQQRLLAKNNNAKRPQPLRKPNRNPACEQKKARHRTARYMSGKVEYNV